MRTVTRATPEVATCWLGKQNLNLIEDFLTPKESGKVILIFATFLFFLSLGHGVALVIGLAFFDFFQNQFLLVRFRGP